jgi:hypothetical protein
VENKFDTVSYRDGKAKLEPDPFVKHRSYERAVARSDAGFVFFRAKAPQVPIVASLLRHGYEPHLVGRFVVYAPPRADLG